MTWRWRYRDEVFRKHQRAARSIQSFERMRRVRLYYIYYEKHNLILYHRCRRLATYVQPLWRGHVGRSVARKMMEMKYLPDPTRTSTSTGSTSITNHEFWLQIQKIAHPPKRSWGAFSEYVLSGHPKTWYERNYVKRSVANHARGKDNSNDNDREQEYGKKRETSSKTKKTRGAKSSVLASHTNYYYRDVKFYVNHVTRRSSWHQPPDWKRIDDRERRDRIAIFKMGHTMEQVKACQKLQHLWRRVVANQHLKLILKAQRLIGGGSSAAGGGLGRGGGSQDRYYANPDNMSALCNYALYVHIGLRDMPLAKRLYDSCMEKMMTRGGDNAFILYSYAIFLAVTAKEDSEFLAFMKRAQAAEDRYKKRFNTQERDHDGTMHLSSRTKKSSIYELANAYFRQIAICEEVSICWYNYALCRYVSFSPF